MSYLVYKANRVELEKTLSIGRDKNCDLTINELTVSRNHSIIKKIGEKYYIIDSGSSNGTYKDGKRVHSPVLLEDKSIIQCGNAQIIFYDNLEIEDEEETMIAFSSNFIIKSVILVADIRGYTTFSEIIPIKKVSKFMSYWFRDISNCIEENNGYIDSFIGDCVYARWDVDANKDVILNVLNAAKLMNNITKELTLKTTEGQSSLSLGVGIHIGDIIVGAETNNTGLGDTVNTAFRLEEKTRNLDTDIIISQEIFDLIEIDKELIDVTLKGKNNNTKVCAISFNEIDHII